MEGVALIQSCFAGDILLKTYCVAAFIIFTPRVFHISVSWWFFHRSLSDSKSPQFSRTLLSILTDFNNAVVWTVSTHPVISKSSSPCSNPLVIVPRAPITTAIIITFMFHSFFNSLARLRYLFLFSHSFNFALRSTGTAESTILQVLTFLSGRD